MSPVNMTCRLAKAEEALGRPYEESCPCPDGSICSWFSPTRSRPSFLQQRHSSRAGNRSVCRPLRPVRLLPTRVAHRPSARPLCNLRPDPGLCPPHLVSSLATLLRQVSEARGSEEGGRKGLRRMEGTTRRYFYDTRYGHCRAFYSTGCDGGNANNFPTLAVCRQTCVEGSSSCGSSCVPFFG